MELIALADDATGALEVGALLAGHGINAMVGFETFPASASAVVVDLETRHLTPAQAEHTVAEAMLEARRAGAQYIFKKTDSTLRGNIAAEFQGIWQVYPNWPIIYSPAYPKMGRIVREGMLFVHGQPLAETEFARDPLNPVREGSVIRMLEAALHQPVALAAGVRELAERLQQSARVIVCNGAVDDDLREIAQLLAGCPKPYAAAGPAGFVEYWAPLLPLEHSPRQPHSRVRRGLIINGSSHPVSRHQVRQPGVPGFYVGAALGTITGALRDHSWVSLSTPDQPAGDPLEVASRLAGEVVALNKSTQLDALVIVGGDTVFAVLRKLGVNSVYPCGELLPGIPLSRFQCEGGAHYLATKAGGFGVADEMDRIVRQLEAVG